MAKLVVGTFSSRDQAERGADRLQQAGFSRDQISLVSKDDRARRNQEGGDDAAGAMGETSEGLTWGAGIGAGAGLLASAGALAIPGIGPLLAAGPLAATLSGATMGGLAGGLVDWGLPEGRGRFYEGEVRQGRVLATVRCEQDRVSEAERELEEAGADHVESHESKR